jgi:hypothetical protein
MMTPWREERQARVTDAKMDKAVEAITAVLHKLFGEDDSGDPLVEFELTDRTRYERCHHLDIPYIDHDTPLNVRIEALRMAEGNLAIAAETLRQVVRQLEEYYRPLS